MLFIYIANNLVLITLFFLYCTKLFSQKKSNKYKFLILFVFIMAKSMVNLCGLFQINSILTITVYFAISFIFFTGTLTKRIVFIGFFLIASFISEIVSHVFLVALLDSVINESVLIYPLFGNIFSRIILIIIYLIIKLNSVKMIVDSKGLGYFIVFPIISIIIIYSLMNSSLLKTDPVLCTMISIGILVFNLIICTGFVEIINSKNVQIENEKLRSQELHYLLLEEKMENSKRFIHDFKKHINLINEYVSSQNIDKLKLYLNVLSDEVIKDDNLILTGNQLIDLLLNANRKVLSSNSITIKYDIKIKEVSPISEYDFNIIFSNILDNAIDSCIRAKGDFIKIKLNKIDGILILKIINPCLEINKNLESLKSNKEDHGYGIQNIRKIVQKYKGTTNFKFDSENSVFISTILV